MNYSADLNCRPIIAKFLEKNGVVGYGALWNGVYLPTCEKKIFPPFADMSFAGLSYMWKQEDFLKSVLSTYMLVLVVLEDGEAKVLRYCCSDMAISAALFTGRMESYFSQT